MPLPAEETTKVSELAAATVLSDTDLLLITRTGANVKAALSLLLAYINDNIDLSVYAPLASPAMTGTPTAPTAEPGTDTTQLATTAFVESVRLAIIQVIAGLTAASVGADPSGTAAAALLAHLESADAHGDRAYADGIVLALADIVDGLNAASVGADAAGTATSTVSAHSSATDPHGDRSYAASVATDAEVAAKNYADLLVASALRLRGGYDASGNAWPTTGGTGTAGAIKTGNLWFVSVPGTLGGKNVVVGDSFFAVSDAPGQTSANWCVLDTNLGFVPEMSGAAASAIAAHLLAADPHGDRAFAIQRGNHTGTQAAATISDFTAAAKLAVIAAVAGILKADGSGNVSAAVAGTDYATPAQILKVNASPTVIERGHKFGQFTRFSNTSPNNCYSFQGASGGSSIALTTTKLASVAGNAAISDALYWSITSSSNGAAFALSTAVWHQTTGDVVSTRWQTGDKMQAIFSLSLTDLSPSPTNNFVFRVGLANATGQKITDADVFSSATGGAHDGSAAYFFADKDSAYWQCKSGHLTATEVTVTTVAVAIDIFHVFHILVSANGAVSFYIDGALVATHNTGVIASGKCLNESIGFLNRALTATANKGCILDQIAFRHELANQRQGFAFV